MPISHCKGALSLVYQVIYPLHTLLPAIFTGAFCLIVFIHSTATISPAQINKIRFDRLNNEHGLSNNSIHVIYQDSKGFIWIGTEDGLNRFDGFQVISYRNNPLKPTSISGNEITSIYEDRAGKLWIGTHHSGLNLYDPVGDKFIRFQDPSLNTSVGNPSRIVSMYEDSAGGFWLGTRYNLLKFDRATGVFTTYSLPDNHEEILISALVEDQQGNFWVGTSIGLWLFDRSLAKFSFYDDLDVEPLKQDITALLLDAQGSLYIGSRHGLYVIDTKVKKNVTHYLANTENSIDPSSDIRALAASGELLWIGTNGDGLKCLNLRSKTFTYNKFNQKDPHSLIGNNVVALCVDRSSVLWVGDSAFGISTFAPYKNKFRLYRHNPYDDNSLSDNYIRGICEDRQGKLWVATEFGGLNCIDRQNDRVIRYQKRSSANSLNTNEVWAVFEDHAGVLWVGLGSGGLQTLDRETGRFTQVKLLPSDEGVNVIYEDKRKNLWVGTRNGLFLIGEDRHSVNFYRQNIGLKHYDGDGAIQAILEDSTGNIWLGTDEGIVRLNPDTMAAITYREEIGFSKDGRYVTYFLEDSQGNIWIATKGTGIHQYNRKQNQFIHIDEQQGLPHNNVYGIVDDNKGNLWLSTDKGIARFNPHTTTFKSFTISDGLQGPEFNRIAVFKSPAGEIFFGGTNGLNSFLPDEIKTNPIAPPVEILSFKVNELLMPLTPNLELNYNQNSIAVEYAAMDFNAPTQNLYARKLEGFDTDWVQVGNKREAAYINLKPGNYTLHIKATNNDGVWNETGVAIKFTIITPFWERWWAYLLYILVVMSSFYGIYRFNINRIRIAGQLREAKLLITKAEDEKRILQVQAETLKSKTEANEAKLQMQILRYQLNPHFLFNAFSSIRSLFRTNARTAELVIEQLSDYMRYLLTNNKLEVTLGEEINAIENYLAIEQIRFEEKLKTSISVDKSEYTVLIPAFILQPLFENAIKHGMKTSSNPLCVEMTCWREDGSLFLCVANTGRWVETANDSARMDGFGVGLKNVQERLKQFYPTHNSFVIKEDGEMVKVIINIPLN